MIFKTTLVGLLIASSCTAIYADVCPLPNAIGYNATSNSYTAPAGWSVTDTPHLPNGGGPVAEWIEASWQGNNAPQPFANHITCSYLLTVFKQGPGSILSITKNNPSADPWKTESKTLWNDQGSHKNYPNTPWDFCQESAGGTVSNCVFP